MNEQHLRALMFRFPNSFVGFFDTTSQVLRALAGEWFSYYYRTRDERAHKWGSVLVSASKKLDEITVELSAIRDEHDTAFATEQVMAVRSPEDRNKDGYTQ